MESSVFFSGTVVAESESSGAGIAVVPPGAAAGCSSSKVSVFQPSTLEPDSLPSESKISSGSAKLFSDDAKVVPDFPDSEPVVPFSGVVVSVFSAVSVEYWGSGGPSGSVFAASGSVVREESSEIDSSFSLFSLSFASFVFLVSFISFISAVESTSSAVSSEMAASGSSARVESSVFGSSSEAVGEAESSEPGSSEASGDASGEVD